MKKQISVLLFLLSLAYVTPAMAQSDVSPIPSIYTINVNGKTYEAMGSVLTIEFTNLAEEFYLCTLKMDATIFADKLEFARQKAMELEWHPVEKNNDDTYERRSVTWEKKGEVIVESDGKLTSVNYDNDDIWVQIVHTKDGPVIRSGPSTGESL